MRPVQIAAFVLLGSSCETVETRYVDPTYDVSLVGITSLVEGPPSVDMGFLSTEGFTPIQDGGPLQVIWGQQGGFWTMPSIRLVGIGSPALVSCEVILTDEETVGQVNAKARFSPGERYFEAVGFPIPIRHEGAEDPDAIDDLWGQAADLRCTVTDSEDRSGSLERRVIITRS